MNYVKDQFVDDCYLCGDPAVVSILGTNGTEDLVLHPMCDKHWSDWRIIYTSEHHVRFCLDMVWSMDARRQLVMVPL